MINTEFRKVRVNAISRSTEFESPQNVGSTLEQQYFDRWQAGSTKFDLTW